MPMPMAVAGAALVTAHKAPRAAGQTILRPLPLPRGLLMLRDHHPQRRLVRMQRDSAVLLPQRICHVVRLVLELIALQLEVYRHRLVDAEGRLRPLKSVYFNAHGACAERQGVQGAPAESQMVPCSVRGHEQRPPNHMEVAQGQGGVVYDVVGVLEMDAEGGLVGEHSETLHYRAVQAPWGNHAVSVTVVGQPGHRVGPVERQVGVLERRCRSQSQSLLMHR
mmetsp:Transcript_25404/g.56266  ORF Transcript_25404/g.56266 Transcript_25404/m.56266 type:complete len:222 (-) Transcript_25404:235-900(-)